MRMPNSTRRREARAHAEKTKPTIRLPSSARFTALEVIWISPARARPLVQKVATRRPPVEKPPQIQNRLSFSSPPA
jgi:hypothetical protein